MPSNTYPIIAREGWLALVLLALFLLLSFFYLNHLISVVFGALFCTTIFLLRDPRQAIPSQPLAIVSPVYGCVISQNTVNDPWIEREAIRIRLKISFLDIYSIRSPTEGKIINQWSKHDDNGKHHFAFWIKSDEGDDAVIDIHLNRFTALCFRFYAHSGERIGQGQRCGFLFFGGVVDVLLPVNSKIQVNAGERITSGSGVLAQFVHTGSASVIKEDQKAAV